MNVQELKIGPMRIWPPVLSAPMAGFSNYAWRTLLRELGGVGLVTTEMVSARAFVYKAHDEDGEELGRLWGVENEARPLSVQIWDNDPDALAATALRLARAYHVSVVDMNFGCPAPKIVKRSASGSWLLRDPDRLGQLVASVVSAAAPVPVTVKIRLGLTLDRIVAGEVAEAVEEAGASAITVHGRTTSQMYSGRANWDAIGHVKDHLKSIPLIGNGDIRTVSEAIDRLTNYPVDGIMIGRAGFDRPWLFRQIKEALEGREVSGEPGSEEVRAILLRLYELSRMRYGEASAVLLMRRYACHYSKGRRGGSAFRDQISRVGTEPELLRLLNSFFVKETETEPSIKSGLKEGV
ncbi:MAG: tRNA-dihydrouridine synthase [Planctomycetia bacterium]|nr:tRNA-dihydrouridine synthase [Planctomycetia bacterium]